MISQPTCLIVEDSDVVRKVMRFVVEGLNFSVNDLNSTEDALARCKREMPDLIVLDWHIPGSAPIEFIAAVRSLPLGRNVKILYVLTNNDTTEIGRAITCGANDFMLKPFHRVTMEAKVAALITKKRDQTDELEPAGKPLRAPLVASAR